ncbi:hypothetical protein ABZ896_27945 [Streptomyces sp. NPDC047072]|uniref:hypothetical protein n=1 Tax=Streptomyces sp. NPDC047072 TaxID=3154809 RepID=UPI0033C573B1
MQQSTSLAADRAGQVLARVEARLVGGEDGDDVLAVDLSRHDPESLAAPGALMFNNFQVAFEPDQHTDQPGLQKTFVRGVQTSVAVVSRGWTDEAPDAVVDRVFRTLPGLSTNVAAALVDDHTCRVGLRPRKQPFDLNNEGVLLTMTCQDPDAPVELFPALLYSWVSWWYRRATRLHGREIENREIPSPPERLDLVVRGRRFPVHLRDFTPASWSTSSF